jgi:hypothetical protein
VRTLLDSSGMIKLKLIANRVRNRFLDTSEGAQYARDANNSGP